MKDLKKVFADAIISLLIATFITVVTAIGIYPLLMAVCNIDDFDGYWLIIIMQTIQLTLIIFIGKYIVGIVKKQ